MLVRGLRGKEIGTFNPHLGFGWLGFERLDLVEPCVESAGIIVEVGASDLKCARGGEQEFFRVAARVSGACFLMNRTR